MSYIPALATLLAAFYGAKFAFQFQKDKELIDARKHNLINANRAIFALSRMANKLFLYQRDVINPVRKSPGRFLELRPTLDLEKDLIELDIESLGFLLETVHVNLLGEVIVEEERYRSAIDAINSRSQLHLHTIQPQLEKVTSGPNGLTLEEIKQCLGERLYSTLQQSTDQVVEHVDSSLISVQDIAIKLNKSVKELYPTQKVISFSFPS